MCRRLPLPAASPAPPQSGGAFDLPDNRGFLLHLLQQDFPDQIESPEDLGIGKPVVDDIPLFARHQHAPVFHHV
jgi:hypothetical protein